MSESECWEDKGHEVMMMIRIDFFYLNLLILSKLQQEKISYKSDEEWKTWEQICWGLLYN